MGLGSSDVRVANDHHIAAENVFDIVTGRGGALSSGPKPAGVSFDVRGKHRGRRSGSLARDRGTLRITGKGGVRGALGTTGDGGGRGRVPQGKRVVPRFPHCQKLSQESEREQSQFHKERAPEKKEKTAHCKPSRRSFQNRTKDHHVLMPQ